MIKIIVMIASRGTDIDYRLALTLAGWCKYDSRVSEFVIHKNAYSAPECQEAMFKDLEERQFDYALILDTDVCVEASAMSKLVEAGKDVCVAPVWHYDPSDKCIHLNVHYKSVDRRVFFPKESGIEKIFSSSFACMMVSRKVFDVFRDRRESYTTGGDPLDNMSDNVFYTKLRRMGIQAWVRWDIRTIHYPRVDLCNEVVDNIMVKGLLNRAIESSRLYELPVG